MKTATTKPQASSIRPRRLILELLDADAAMMCNGNRLIAAGGIFGFSTNQMRVALSRLVADGLLAKPQRGRYQLTGESIAMRNEIQRWQQLEAQLRPWHKDWCALVTGNLAAESSTRFRAQTRALKLRGLQRWRPGIWVRPNNLAGGLNQLCEDVSTLGLDAIAGSYLMNETNKDCERSLRILWDTKAINRNYQLRIKQTNAAIKRLETSKTTAVLAETLEFGGDMIRALLMDPLLPDTLLGNSYREQLIAGVKRYDTAGRTLWQQFIQQL